MSNSSQQKKSLDDYLNDIVITDTIDLSGITGDNMGTVSIDTSNDVYITLDSTGAAQSVYTITGNDTITFDSWLTNKEWENSFPDWGRVNDMCEKYPGLKAAFDNFKVFYEMVKDDYDNPKPKK